jgi:hypothetical protein
MQETSFEETVKTTTVVSKAANNNDMTSSITEQPVLKYNFLTHDIILIRELLHYAQRFHEKNSKTRLKILPVLTREHYTSLLHWV